MGLLSSTEPLTDEITRTSVRGTVDLISAQVISAVASLFATAVLARLLGASSFGDIAVIMILPNILLLIQDLGVSQAITRWVAFHSSRNEADEVRAYIRAGLIFEIATGSALTILAFALSSFFATFVIFRTELMSLITLCGAIILGQSLIATAKSVLIGLDKTRSYSLLIVANAILLGFLPIALVGFGYGLSGAVYGIVASSLILGSASLFVTYNNQAQYGMIAPSHPSSLLKHIKIMISFSFPLFLSTLSGGILPQVLYALAAQYLVPADIGNYSAAISLRGVMLFVSAPITTVLFAAFSKINGKDNPTGLREFYTKGVKYTSMFVVPLVALLSTISVPVVLIVFGSGYQLTQYYFVLSLIPSLNVLIGSLVVGGLLKGQNRTRSYFAMHMIQLVMGTVCAMLLVPTMGGQGLFVAMIVSTFLSILSAQIYIYFEYGISIDYGFAMKTSVASFLSAFLGHLVGQIADVGALLFRAFLGAATFSVSFLILFVLLRALKEEDYSEFDILLGGIGLLARPISMLLSVMRRLAVLLRSLDSQPNPSDKLASIGEIDCLDDETRRIEITVNLIPTSAKSILEVGCHDCRIANRIESDKSVVGLDIASKMLSNCEVDAIQASTENLPFGNQAFDCILCTEVLEHLTDSARKNAVREIQRVSGRWILLSVPYNEPLGDVSMRCKSCGLNYHVWGHSKSFSPKELSNLMQDTVVVENTTIGRISYGSFVIRRILNSLGEPTVEIAGECPRCGERFNLNRTIPKLLRRSDALYRKIKSKLGISSAKWIVTLYEKPHNQC